MRATQHRRGVRGARPRLKSAQGLRGARMVPRTEACTGRDMVHAPNAIQSERRDERAHAARVCRAVHCGGSIACAAAQSAAHLSSPKQFSPPYIMYIKPSSSLCCSYTCDAQSRACSTPRAGRGGWSSRGGLRHRAHERGSRRQRVVDEDKDGLLRRDRDALADDVHELPDLRVEMVAGRTQPSVCGWGWG